MSKLRERPLSRLTLREHLLSLQDHRAKSRGLKRVFLSLRLKSLESELRQKDEGSS